MIIFRKINRSFVAILIISLSVFIFSKCISGEKKNSTDQKKVKYGDFAGSASCVSCHKDIYGDHINTGHYNSSQPASENKILGSFQQEHNSFSFNALSKVVMEKREDGYYQVEYLMDKEGRKSRFDITIGSGRKGQSYLSWKNHSLIQMPVTYFTPESTWSGSPGFNPNRIAFNRVVTSRCLECHSTYFETTSSKEKHPEEFDKKNIIYGIDCEKCHGPAKEHVDFHITNPGIKEAKYIVNTGKLPRQVKLDVCGLCHSGRLTKTQPSFSFQSGDSLMDFFTEPNTPVQVGGIDVHGNQLGMLSQSKCFIASDMTCESCHNVHEKEQGRLDVFSQRCAGCHTESKNNLCDLMKTVGNVISQNCIDCHMPLQPSHSIAVFLEGASVPTPAKLRTHYIKVYKEESKKIVEFLKKPEIHK
jgi:Cytochrome c554 and c-prime